MHRLSFSRLREDFMLGHESSLVKEIILGTFEVSVKSEQVSTFVAATGGSQTEVPAAFPVTWLSMPVLREALLTAVGPGHVPVHEFQSFNYSAPLVRGANYYMSAVALRETAPDRIVIDAEVIGLDGVKTLTMRSTLRIVPIKNGAVV
jgi:hypothetical protein